MSNEDWKYNLRKTFVIFLIYQVTYDREKTPLYYQILKNNIDSFNEEQSAIQFKILMDEI